MHTHVKRKRYRAHVRAMLAAGRVNDPDGNWRDTNILDPKVAQRAQRQAERFGRKA